MAPLLAHLVGDYVLQSHVMATRKTSSWLWAAIHALFYTLPFLALTQDSWRLAVIGGTHAVIDRLGIARRWCEWYGVGLPGVWDAAPRIALAAWGRALTSRGYRHGWTKDSIAPFVAPPPFLGVWLIIIVANTMHLLINYAVLS